MVAYPPGGETPGDRYQWWSLIWTIAGVIFGLLALIVAILAFANDRGIFGPAGTNAPSPTAPQPSASNDDVSAASQPADATATPSGNALVEDLTSMERSLWLRGTDYWADMCASAGSTVGSKVTLKFCDQRDELTWAHKEGQLVGYNGLCLALTMNSDSVDVQMQRCTGGPEQSWSLKDNGYFKNRFGKCLDIEGPLVKVGTPLQVWECQDVPQHKWRLMKVQ